MERTLFHSFTFFDKIDWYTTTDSYILYFLRFISVWRFIKIYKAEKSSVHNCSFKTILKVQNCTTNENSKKENRSMKKANLFRKSNFTTFHRKLEQILLFILMCCNIGFIHRIFIANGKTNKCNVFVKGHMNEKTDRDVNLIESPYEHFEESFKTSLLSILYEKQNI